MTCMIEANQKVLAFFHFTLDDLTDAIQLGQWKMSKKNIEVTASITASSLECSKIAAVQSYLYALCRHVI